MLHNYGRIVNSKNTQRDVDMKSNEDLGQRLREIRKQIGESQEDFSFKLNINQQRLSLIERGARPINVKILAILGKFYNVNLNWLINNKGEMFCADQTDMERLQVKQKRVLEISSKLIQIITEK